MPKNSDNKFDRLMQGSTLNRAMPSQRVNPLAGVTSTRSLAGALIVKTVMVTPSPRQIRQNYDAESLQELAADIKERGILQPLVVRETADKNYEIVAGERRWRAAKLLDLDEVPVIVKSLDDNEAQIYMLVENIQREDLDPADEKRYYQQLQNQHNLTLEQIGTLVNKSKNYVHRRLNDDLVSLRREKEARAKSNNIPDAGKTKRLSVTPFRRFSQTFDETLTLLDQTAPDPKTLLNLRESLQEVEEKLSRLKKKLEEFE